MNDAEQLIAWVREAANELERAHQYLDREGATRISNAGVPLTLAARIALFHEHLLTLEADSE